MTTAEWKCTKCGVTNRKLVPAGQTTAKDRCVTCHTRHELHAGPRPTFWEATAGR
jgi:hypothetical protein